MVPEGPVSADALAETPSRPAVPPGTTIWNGSNSFCDARSTAPVETAGASVGRTFTVASTTPGLRVAARAETGRDSAMIRTDRIEVGVRMDRVGSHRPVSGEHPNR